jgi:predicted transcriptional regulator
MRARPSQANMVLLMRRLEGRYAFSIKDIARTMNMSMRNATRYFAMLRQLGLIEPWYLGRDDHRHYYRVRRDK